MGNVRWNIPALRSSIHVRVEGIEGFEGVEDIRVRTEQATEVCGSGPLIGQYDHVLE